MQALRVESVDWDHPDAVALRAAMEAEMVIRYADRLALRRVPRVQVEDGSVAHVAVVYAEDGQPVGHAALRWLDGELELKRMYVAPTHRGAGVSVALLCAIEAAARLSRAKSRSDTASRLLAMGRSKPRALAVM